MASIFVNFIALKICIFHFPLEVLLICLGFLLWTGFQVGVLDVFQSINCVNINLIAVFPLAFLDSGIWKRFIRT